MVLSTRDRNALCHVTEQVMSRLLTAVMSLLRHCSPANAGPCILAPKPLLKRSADGLAAKGMAIDYSKKPLHLSLLIPVSPRSTITPTCSARWRFCL